MIIIIGIIVALVTGIGGWYIRMPFLFAQTSDGIIFRQRVDAGTPVTLAYRHSVQKTMIYEYLEVNQIANGFVLKSTKYQSMGWGFPFPLTRESSGKRTAGLFWMISTGIILSSLSATE